METLWGGPLREKSKNLGKTKKTKKNNILSLLPNLFHFQDLWKIGFFVFFGFLVFSKFFWFCIFLLPIVFFKYLFCNFSSPRHLENFIWDASFDLAVTSFVQNVLMKPFKRQFTTAHLLWKLWRPRSHVLWLRQSQRRARTWRWHRVAGTWSLRTIFGSALENLYMVKPASLTSLALTKPSSAYCTHDVSFPSTSISRA